MIILARSSLESEAPQNQEGVVTWEKNAVVQSGCGRQVTSARRASTRSSGEQLRPSIASSPGRTLGKPCLNWRQVIEVIQQADWVGGCIALRYYAEPYPLEGKAFDSLEWPNAVTLLLLIGQGEILVPAELGSPAELWKNGDGPL
jgi:hypothetical protein